MVLSLELRVIVRPCTGFASQLWIILVGNFYHGLPKEAKPQRKQLTTDYTDYTDGTTSALPTPNPAIEPSV
jgi:hypothetical protein